MSPAEIRRFLLGSKGIPRLQGRGKKPSSDALTEGASYERIQRGKRDALRVLKKDARDFMNSEEFMCADWKRRFADVFKEWRDARDRQRRRQKSDAQQEDLIVRGFADPSEFVEERSISIAPEKRERGRPPVSEDKRQEVVHELELGHTFAEAAGEVGLSVRTVAKIAKEEGFSVSPDARLSEEKRAEIRADLELDSNFSRVARKHSVSDSTVGRIAKQEGFVSEHGNSHGQVQARRFKIAIPG